MMNDQKFDINSLRIASPCSVGWESMTGDERTRHCSLCSLNVHNISDLTAVEVQRLVGKSEGRLCIRMYRRFDGTVLTKDCPVGLSAVRKRVARYAGATLSAILGLFSISFGQREETNSVDASLVKIVRTQAREGAITGKVIDLTGTAVEQARVLLLLDQQERVVFSDAEGVYRLTQLPAGIYELKVTLPGLEEYRVSNLRMDGQEHLDLNIDFRAEVNITVGVVELLPPNPNTMPTTLTPLIPGPQKPGRPGR